MARTKTVSESVVVAVPADVLYQQISDPRNYARWSPENVGATLRGDTAGPAHVGQEFDGHNRNYRGLRRRFNLAMPSWTTRCVVTAAEPGKQFAFKVVGQMMGAKEQPRMAFDIATWEYRLEEVEGGTRVTETWIDERDSSAIGRSTRSGDRIFTGGPTFPQMQAQNMATTLANLKADLEGAAS